KGHAVQQRRFSRPLTSDYQGPAVIQRPVEFVLRVEHETLDFRIDVWRWQRGNRTNGEGNVEIALEYLGITIHSVPRRRTQGLSTMRVCSLLAIKIRHRKGVCRVNKQSLVAST